MKEKNFPTGFTRFALLARSFVDRTGKLKASCECGLKHPSEITHGSNS